ncbi:uncharacterized protein B0H64DRAFT_410715 [Chaetomium fimeti]|uniref:Uncharacterized protein n=1 Tax=Chaetomium fimeti TaxID=1854472 RepID=A0AAE0H6X8_9PEZI|nr:hypothetical protein B0H64DRAFT_410715 [Chaetomium fimeti]
MAADSSHETTPLLPNAEQEDLTHNTDTMGSTLLWKTGAVFGATAVGLGAFGAHGLKKHISDPNKLANWSTAAQYQLVHSVALLVASNNPVAGALFTAGMTMFSGSIYALTLDTERFRFMGPVTPLGGLCLMAGWLALAFGKRGAGMRWPRF